MGKLDVHNKNIAVKIENRILKPTEAEDVTI